MDLDELLDTFLTKEKFKSYLTTTAHIYGRQEDRNKIVKYWLIVLVITQILQSLSIILLLLVIWK